jgi:hypothetical protein
VGGVAADVVLVAAQGFGRREVGSAVDDVAFGDVGGVVAAGYGRSHSPSRALLLFLVESVQAGRVVLSQLAEVVQPVVERPQKAQLGLRFFFGFGGRLGFVNEVEPSDLFLAAFETA